MTREDSANIISYEFGLKAKLSDLTELYFYWSCDPCDEFKSMYFTSGSLYLLISSKQKLHQEVAYKMKNES